MTAVAVLDNVLPQDPTEPRPISSRLPGPWIGEAGMLREGGTLYLIWCVIAVVYVGAMWKWPPLVRPYAPLKVVGRLLGSVGLLVVVSVMLFLMLLPTGS